MAGGRDAVAYNFRGVEKVAIMTVLKAHLSFLSDPSFLQ